jgi:apolipoprotein N-acyltransferase
MSGDESHPALRRAGNWLAAHPALVSLVLGAAAAAGFAPLQLWPLSLLCLAGWMALVQRAPSLRAALWQGWLFGVGHFTINNNWIQHAFTFQDKMPPVLGYLAVVLLALYLAVYPMLAAALAWRVAGRGRAPDSAYVLAFGASWIASEWLRGTLFTGYAWDPLGVIWVPAAPIAHIARLTGTYALSGLTIVLAGGLLLFARRTWKPGTAMVALIAVLSLAAIDHSPAPAPIAANAPRLRVVQPNIGQDQRGDDDGEVMHAALAALSGTPGAAPRLILWPEGVIREYIEDGYPLYYYGAIDPYYARLRLARLLGPHDLLLAGGTALEFDQRGQLRSAGNAVFAVGPDAEIRGRYDKAHLVPYGEYLPMRPILSAIGLSRLVPGDLDFKPGPGPRTIAFPGFGAIGFQVCYEIIFSGEVVDPAHRPRLIFNPSNDAWFGEWGPPQHLAQARMRAIEEGLPIVRATPTGISAVIDADGHLLATVPQHIAGAIELPIPVAHPPTLFARLGNWMAALVALLLAAAAIAIARRAR